MRYKASDSFQRIGFVLLIAISSMASAQRLQPAAIDSLTVNFISIGAGTDHKAEERFAAYIKSFQKENKVTLRYKIKPWGKEGETEYKISLKNLGQKQRRTFKHALNEMFKENKRVKIGGSS